jgi:hypothetical protein
MEDGPRLAILVIAHANPATFRRMAAALRHPRIRLFVHLDARVDETPFREPGQDHVTFLAARQENHWGGFSQVEVAARLFDAARAEGPFASYVLISGDTLPLVTNEALIAAFAATPTVVLLRKLPPGDLNYRRVSDVYVVHARLGRLKLADFARDRSLAPGDLEEVQRAAQTAALKRELGFEVYKGAQWLALSEAHLAKLTGWLRANPAFVEIFRYSLMPDESFIQSALPLVLPNYRGGPPIVAVDWSRKPKPFTVREVAEMDRIFADGAPFFRKFADDGAAVQEAVLAARRDLPAIRAARKGTTFGLLRGAAPPPARKPAQGAA